MQLTPAFKLVFLSVLGLTILSLAVSVLLTLNPSPSEEVRRLIETCSTTFKMGFGAMVGLIAGKKL
jgi:fucose permease